MSGRSGHCRRVSSTSWVSLVNTDLNCSLRIRAMEGASEKSWPRPVEIHLGYPAVEIWRTRRKALRPHALARQLGCCWRIPSVLVWVRLEFHYELPWMQSCSLVSLTSLLFSRVGASCDTSSSSYLWAMGRCSAYLIVCLGYVFTRVSQFSSTLLALYEVMNSSLKVMVSDFMASQLAWSPLWFLVDLSFNKNIS